MGLIRTDIKLVHAGDEYDLRKGRIQPNEVREQMTSALVDSGAYTLCINEDIQRRMGLETMETTTATLADGSIQEVRLAEPITIYFGERKSTCRPVILPGDAEVLLGALPMEDMDLVVDMRNHALIQNPGPPFLPQHVLKGMRK